MCGFSIIFKRNCDILKSKSPCILLNKNINLNKNNQKWKTSCTVLERFSFCFSLYKSHKLKANLCWAGTFFVPVYFVQGKFLCFISMYSILNTLSEYPYFQMSQNALLYAYFDYFFACFWNCWKPSAYPYILIKGWITCS